ncbi:uncharacterized protein K02A2.6-like [Musca domestica]|uniref:RNA-directed DNA polymerase n=1 Tax=Musca domestica TaxID=7370 RepID=A0ABM3UQ06_MUSDO|nr:uncharacterized protein K02A2.6-like [Musca domestica]
MSQDIILQLLTEQQKAMSQQTQLLKHMADLLQAQGAPNSPHSPQTSNSSKAALMESLAQSMTAFVYEPESGLIFQAWYNRFVHVFEKEASSLEEHDKVALLWRKMSNQVHERFANYVLPAKPEDMTLKDTVEKLKKLFGKTETQVSQRYKCLQLAKGDSEDFREYASRVNLQCELFKMKELKIDQFKCLIFVLGLKSEKDNDIRLRLLKVLDDENTTMNLDQLVDETQRILDLKSDNILIEHQSKIVCSLNKHAKDFKKHKTPNSPCWYCGDLHYVKFCPFQKHKCTTCNQVGHKNNFCNIAKTGKNFKSSSENNQNEFKKYSNSRKSFKTKAVFKTHNINFRDLRKYTTVLINNNPVKLQIDTASDISIVSINTWKAIGKPEAYETFDNASDANANSIKLLAEFQCDVTIDKTSKTLKCYITDIEKLNIMGIDWIQAFNLWQKPITSWCHQINFVDEIAELKTNYQSVFDNSTPGLCKTKVNIQLLPNTKEIFVPKRPVPFAARMEIETELLRLENAGIITPVDSSRYAAPIVVSKRNGKIRICADYSTGLNSIVEPNQYPLPTPEEIMSDCHNCVIFSHLDLSDAYLQVEVDDESKELLTINTHKGLYKFNRLTPGIKSAPGAFQRIMDKLCAGIEGAKAYIDDIMLSSPSIPEHKLNLNKLLQRIQDHGFKLKFEKCQFFQKQIKYLGHIISKDGIKPDPIKIAAVQNLKTPENVSEVRSLLGSINHYGKFVNNMRTLRKPLDDLLKKDAKFEWTSQCQKSLNDFKNILTSDLLLTHYNPNLPIHVAADASSHGIGAVIYHMFPDNTMKAIHHISRSLTQAEKNYSQIEKEGLALIFAVQRFHKMLFGRKFTLHTDHKPLLAIFGSKKGVPIYTANRLQRWALILLAYNFEIKYTNTKDFGHADVLSRLVKNHEKPADDFIVASISFEEDIRNEINETMSVLPVSFKMIVDATTKDTDLQMVLKYIQTEWPESKKNINPSIIQFFNRKENLSTFDGCILFNNRIVIPKSYQRQILQQLHRGHLSAERSKAIARSYVYWPNIDKQIEDFVRKCKNCQHAAKSPVKTNLCPWPLTSHPLERIHIDYAGPEKGKYYLLIIDSYSKYPVIYETTTTTTYATLKMLNEYCALFGNPEQLVSDNGTQFCSEQFEKWCSKKGIKHTRTVRFHPSSNGQAERFVDTLKRALKKLEGEETPTESLQTFLEVYRSTPNPNAPEGKSPAESFIGRKMRTVFDVLRKQQSPEYNVNHKMEQQYNTKHGTKNREFSNGELVYARNFKGNKSYWTTGEIVERKGKVIYNTLIDVGDRKILVRAHTDQLRHRESVESSSQERQKLPLDVLLEEFEIALPNHQEHFATPTGSPNWTPQRITSRRQPVEPISRSPSHLKEGDVGATHINNMASHVATSYTATPT